MLPPDFRDILVSRAEGGKLVLTSFDDCVMGYPLPDWEDFERKFSNLKNPSRKMRDFRRLVIGSAHQGRGAAGPGQPLRNLGPGPL